MLGSMLVRLGLFAIVASVAVSFAATAGKVRIDARAHLATADGLLARARSSADRIAAGEACVRALGSYVPFDPTARAAVGSLEMVVMELRRAGQVDAAQRLLDDALRTIDHHAILFTPLVTERERLARLAAAIAAEPITTETTE